MNGNIMLKAQNGKGLIFYQCSNGFKGTAKANQMIFIPTQGPGTINIKAIEISTGCESILNVSINGQVTSSISVDIPLKFLKACNATQTGEATGTVSGGIEPILTRWILNGEIVSNNSVLKFRKDGYYTFEAYDNCGHKATKSILLGCSNCTEFPEILQYNKCWDECDKFLESECSKLKLAVNCNAGGSFTIVWPEGPETGVKDCKIYQGARYFKPKLPGEYKVIIISATGCVKEIIYNFNEGSWCLEDLMEGDNGKVVGLISNSGGCNSDPILFPNSNFKKLQFIPNNKDFPCLFGGQILLPWECRKQEVLEPTASEYYGESTNGDCITCNFIIENVQYSVETCDFKCPTKFTVSPNPMSFSNSHISIKLQSLIAVKAKLSLKINGTPQYNHEYDLDIVPGFNEIDVQLNGGLPITQDALFQIEFPNSCAKLYFRVIVSNLRDNDNDTNRFKGNCNDDFINIVLDNKVNKFVIFAPIVDSLGLKINSAIYQGVGDLSELPLYSEIYVPFEKVEYLRVDESKNHFILGSDHTGKLKYQKIDSLGTIYWTKDLPNLDVKTMSDGNTGDYNIIAYDSTLHKYISVPINKVGERGTSTVLPLRDVPYKLIHQSGITTVALEGNSTLIFATTTESISKNVHQGITIKDIKTLKNGYILAVGEFNGLVSVSGLSYDSDEFNNVIFITFDKVGNILSSQSIQNYRDETVHGIATKGNEEVAYHGRYKEIVIYSANPLDNVIDSCTFVEIIDLPCDTLKSNLSFVKDSCSILWDTIPSGYTTSLQRLYEQNWINTGFNNLETKKYLALSSLIDDTTLRIVNSKNGCPDIVSDSIYVNCNCDCPLLDLHFSIEDCSFSWLDSICNTASLQYQSNGVWTNVAGATSPYILGENNQGSYRIQYSKATCPPAYSNVVEASCTVCTHSMPVLTYYDSTCTLSWDTTASNGFTSTLQHKMNDVWQAVVNASSPYVIPSGQDGEYRLLSSKQGCSEVQISNVIQTNCACDVSNPYLVYDDANCVLYWNSPSVNEISRLQKLVGSEWQDMLIGFQQYEIPLGGDGSYRVVFQSDLCSVVNISNMVSTTCGCPTATPSLTVSGCELTWEASKIFGQTTVIQKLVNNTWYDVGSASPYQLGMKLHTYRLAIFSNDCPPRYSAEFTAGGSDCGYACGSRLEIDPLICEVVWHPCVNTSLYFRGDSMAAWTKVDSFHIGQDGIYSVHAKAGQYKLVTDGLESNIVDGCTSCSADPLPLLSANQCVWSWIPKPNLILQSEINGIWTDLPGVSPPYVSKDAYSKRLKFANPICDTKYGSALSSVCDLTNCICTSISITYNSQANQILWNTPCMGYIFTLQYKSVGSTQWGNLTTSNAVYHIPVNKSGDYRIIAKKDGCPDQFSATVRAITSVCKCDIPNMIYDSTLCSISWLSSTCAQFSTHLQKLDGNTWTTVTGALSPYQIPTGKAGLYRVRVKSDSCPDIYSTPIHANCASCSCPAPVLNYNSSSCTFTWSATNCTGGYLIHLQLQDNGTWTTVTGAASPYTIPTGRDGGYRLRLSGTS
ncbi:MAG: hypothetical protein WAU01_07350, partial [Saprospiraceae bacterium]